MMTKAGGFTFPWGQSYEAHQHCRCVNCAGFDFANAGRKLHCAGHAGGQPLDAESSAGFTVSGWQGAVLTEWRAEELQWQQEGMSLHLSNAHMQIRPSCLLRSTLCLDTLEVERIALVLPPTETVDEPEQALGLPDLQLPLQIEVQRLSVGEFILNGESLVTAAGLRARWLADGIHIAELGLSHQEYSVQVKGNIVPQADWPLQLQVAAQIPIPDEPNLTVQAQFSGSLHTLTLNAQTAGYLAAT